MKIDLNDLTPKQLAYYVRRLEEENRRMRSILIHHELDMPSPTSEKVQRTGLADVSTDAARLISPTAQGYTGDACGECGGMRMRRNGSCLVCDDCGATTGCS